MDQSLESRIRERAYEIWIAHGCIHDEADQHWLTAERQVLTSLAAALPRENDTQKKKRGLPAGSKRTKYGKPSTKAARGTASTCGTG